MSSNGVEWTEPPEGESPIADPPHDAIRQAVPFGTVEIIEIDLDADSPEKVEAAIDRFCQRATAHLEPNAIDHVHDWNEVKQLNPATGVEEPAFARCSTCGKEAGLDALNEIPF